MLTGYRRAFSLLELLVTLVLISILAVLGFQAGSRVLSRADQADSLACLRNLGQAMLLYGGDHQQSLPGPLWPGQMLLYDANREGRLVREVAPYLEVEPRDLPYLVTRLIPRAYRRAVPAEKLPSTRIYVMNTAIEVQGEERAPFGDLRTDPQTPTMRQSQLRNLSAEDRWMMSEADQKHPDVSTAPWRNNTPREPVHQGRRAVMDFDGAIRLEGAEPQ